MKKVPITSIINKWLQVDDELKAKCEAENCKYDSDSAYKGYVIGFEDGVNSQINDEIAKPDIIKAYKEIYASGEYTSLVSEEDCMRLISSSTEYWFLAGAIWMLKKVTNNLD